MRPAGCGCSNPRAPIFPTAASAAISFMSRDCAEVVLWLLDHPKVSGLFNLGTGQARSFLDLAQAVKKALPEMKLEIEFFDMPAGLKDRYQNFTEAKMDRLRAAGYTKPFTSLEDGTADYLRNYLEAADPYL